MYVSMFLIYSPDGSNIYDARGGKFEGIGSVGVESCKIAFLWRTSCSRVQTLLLWDMYRLAASMASQTNGRTSAGQTNMQTTLTPVRSTKNRC